MGVGSHVGIASALVVERILRRESTLLCIQILEDRRVL